MYLKNSFANQHRCALVDVQLLNERKIMKEITTFLWTDISLIFCKKSGVNLYEAAGGDMQCMMLSLHFVEPTFSTGHYLSKFDASNISTI